MDGCKRVKNEHTQTKQKKKEKNMYKIMDYLNKNTRVNIKRVIYIYI